MDDELGPTFVCDECDLHFHVIADNDHQIMQGEPFVLYCPRCGSDDIEKRKPTP